MPILFHQSSMKKWSKAEECFPIAMDAEGKFYAAMLFFEHYRADDKGKVRTVSYGEVGQFIPQNGKENRNEEIAFFFLRLYEICQALITSNANSKMNLAEADEKLALHIARQLRCCSPSSRWNICGT